MLSIVTLWLAIPLLGICSKKLKTVVQAKISTQMFIAAPFIIAEKKRQPYAYKSMNYKQVAVCCGILSDWKKEDSICYSVGEPERSQSHMIT